MYNCISVGVILSCLLICNIIREQTNRNYYSKYENIGHIEKIDRKFIKDELYWV